MDSLAPNTVQRLARKFLSGLVAAALLLPSGCRPETAETTAAAPGPEAAVARLPFYHDASFTPYWYEVGKKPPDTLHTVAPFRFTDQHGQAVTNATLAGRIYLANFFFTECPGICPRMGDNLRQVLRRFANRPEVVVVSHSVMPERDKVPVLRAYAQDHGIDSLRWHLVTGTRAAIYGVARQQYFAEQRPEATADTGRFLHTEHILLVDGTGHLRGLYNGTLALDALRMEEDIALLLKEQ